VEACAELGLALWSKEKGRICMRVFSVVLRGCAVRAQPLFGQMGAPDAKPEPGCRGCGPLAAKYKADADRICRQRRPMRMAMRR